MARNLSLTLLTGGVAGVTAANAAMYYAKYVATYNAVFQSKIAQAPELTDKVLSAASTAANNAAMSYLPNVVVFSALAAITAALAIYWATGKE